METQEWDSLCIEVNEYLEADTTLDAGLRQVVELNLQIGTNNPNESVRVAIDRICGVVEEAALGFYNHDPIIASISMKHIKSGGGVYDSAEDYASAVVKRNRNMLGKMFKDNSWDGSVDSLLPSDE